MKIKEEKSSKEEYEISTKERTFLKNLQRSASHAKEIAAGKRKGNSVKTLLDEI